MAHNFSTQYTLLSMMTPPSYVMPSASDIAQNIFILHFSVVLHCAKGFGSTALGNDSCYLKLFSFYMTIEKD